MSLRTDQFFFNALKASDSISTTLDGRIFNPDRSTIDEDEDRIPYIIIRMEGLTNSSQTKDDIEGSTDSVRISLLCVADDRDSLAELTEAIRQQCRSYWESVVDDETADDHLLAPIDWSFSAGEVNYDAMKPCVYQILTYECDTYRD